MLADDLLGALDPEQREVAEALRGPVGCRRVPAPARRGRSPTGSPTASPRVSTTRRGPRRHLHHPAPARCAPACAGWAPAPSRPAPSTPRRCARCATSGPRCTARPPELTASKIPWSRGRPGATGSRAARRCCATWPARSSGPRQQRPSRRLCAPRPAPRPRGQRRRRGDGVARLRQRRGAQARPGPDGHGGRPAHRAALLSEDERVAAEVRRQYKWFVVDEFQDVSPIQSALLDLWLGGRDEICVVGDPAQTIYPSPAPRPPT